MILIFEAKYIDNNNIKNVIIMKTITLKENCLDLIILSDNMKDKKGIVAKIKASKGEVEKDNSRPNNSPEIFIKS